MRSTKTSTAERSSPRAARLARSLAAALLGVLAGGCLIARQPPPEADGPTIYAMQLCANCHGDRGEGKTQGPPLRDLGAHWTATDLADFLRDPDAWEARDPRLAQLAADHSGDMAGYANLSLAQRVRLAEYLLSL